MTRLASCASAAVLMLAAGLSGPALAQTSPLSAPPPANYSLDGNGVDLTSGQYMLSVTPVQIGQPGGPGIAYNRTFIRGLGWRDNVTGTLSSSDSTYYVSIGASTDVFTLSGSTFTPVRNVGQTLTLSGSIYTYTMPDGTTARFDGTYANVLLPPPAPAPQMEANRGRMTQLRRPNGETLTYWWETAQREIITEPNWWAIRLDRVTSNYGYALDLAYEWDGYPDYNDVEAWRKLVTVTASNAVACASPTSCPGTVWPSATFSGNNITDQGGRTTYYSGSALRLPENPSTDAVSITKDTNGRVITYSTGGGTWTYAYSVAGNELTVTITDPGSGVTVAKTDTTTGLLTSIRDPLNRTTSYQYDTSRRPTKITYPEGNSVSYAYDARGNVTTTTAEAPPASTEADIVTSATYPATCANRVTCNQPTTTTDARGGVTNYEYDAVHGGVTRITLPAPASGAQRPETRIAYDERHAWLSNGSGGYTEVAAGVTLPVSISTCAEGSAPACVGTDDEIRTTITYGSTGVANNLHPTVIAQGGGDGSLTATNTLTWTNKGDVASVDGPLAGTGDTTTYRYDANRQVVGVIGPDPDGSGPLPRRAMRNTYDDNGAVTLTEQGSVAGLTDANWAAFVSLQQAATTYDAYSRPTHQRLRSGSTTYGLSQVSYDTSGRADCVVTRMNPATFASPPASACTPAAAGTYGPDRIVKHGYDAAGQLTSATSGYGSDPITESVTYTDNGQPETLTDGEGNVSTFVYDGFDRLAQLRYPNPSGGGSSTTDYEAYTYDEASNVLTYRTRGGDVFTSTYDALGRQTAVDSPAGTPDFAYTYDNLGRRLTSVSNGQTLAWTWDALGRQTAETGALGTVYSQYDSAGRRTHLTWPGAPAFYVQYDYDVYGALTRVRENGAATGAGVLAAYTYDSLGRRTAAAFGNGASTTWGYDNVGRLTSLAHNLAGSADDVSFTYAYNPANQITQRTMSNSVYAWTPGAGSTAYQNNGRNQVTSVGGAAVGYDPNQNISSALGDTYAYDDLNRLVGANPGSAATLAYDPAGRLERTTGATTTRFLYDGVQAIAEYNGSGILLRRHIPGAGLDQTVATLEGSGTTDRRWLAADERGSVMAITGGTAALLTRNRYDEYGVPASTNGGRFQYTGQMWIGEAGVYHYRARAYAPQLGRFLQTDPMVYGAGANIYGYVGGDPVNSMDPLGLCDDPNDPKCAYKLEDILVRKIEPSSFFYRLWRTGFWNERGRGFFGLQQPADPTPRVKELIWFDCPVLEAELAAGAVAEGQVTAPFASGGATADAGSARLTIGLEGADVHVNHELSGNLWLGREGFGLGYTAGYRSEIPVPRPEGERGLDFQPVDSTFVGFEAGGALILGGTLRSGYNIPKDGKCE